MIDFAKLKTPPRHGDVLVAPDPNRWSAAIEGNGDALSTMNRRIAGIPLAQWRRRTRQAIVGDIHGPLIVLGHQPGFIHPGVWAKHVVAARAAKALGGVALNLIVDSDVPKRSVLSIPTLLGDTVSVEHLAFPPAPAGFAYEQFARPCADAVANLRGKVENAMGRRFSDSALPAYFDGLAATGDSADWVDQTVAGRRAAEATFGIACTERRVSDLWCTPLVCDMLQNAGAFADSYNSALATYRRDQRIRGAQRPMPDLLRKHDRVELALWAVRPDRVRRRAYVSTKADRSQLFAGEELIGECAPHAMESPDDLEAAIKNMNGWELRPRALTLTIWARLLLADLFVHGIGGAKYDRISDSIIQSYYGVAAPAMACVSATLHVGFNTVAGDPHAAAQFRRTLRDARWNPQRHLPRDDDLQNLFDQRIDAVRHARDLRNRARDLRSRDHRNRTARREAFLRIREVNNAIHARRPGLLEQGRDQLRRANDQSDQQAIATGREFFFALYPRKHLDDLLAALPETTSFRV